MTGTPCDVPVPRMVIFKLLSFGYEISKNETISPGEDPENFGYFYEKNERTSLYDPKHTGRQPCEHCHPR